MDIRNPAFLLDIAEEYPPLIDSTLEEAGEMKLEIHRLRNRVNVIKSFYQHMRSSTNHVVRRELEDKVNAEIDILMATLANVQISLKRWENSTEIKRKTELLKIVEYLKEVLSEYEETLNQHRSENIRELQSLLKATSETDNVSSLLVVDQSRLQTATEKTHIEIEERYSEMLRTDIALRNLRTKFGHLFASTDHTEYAVLQLSQFINHNDDYEDTRMPTTFFKTIILTTLLGLSCIFIIVMLYVLL